MKYQGIKHIITVCLGVCTLIACNDNLEIAPPSSIIPEDYLKEESQLDSYIINRYTGLPNSGGGVGLDNGTDNEAGMDFSTKYTDGDWKVGETGGEWNFEEIYQLNYFLDRVLPMYQNGEISGSKEKYRTLYWRGLSP